MILSCVKKRLFIYNYKDINSPEQNICLTYSYIDVKITIFTVKNIIIQIRIKSAFINQESNIKIF